MARDSESIGWGTVVASLTRPYPVTASMVVLALLVPCYIFIGELMPGRAVRVPMVALDRLLPLQPAWSVVYASLYLFVLMPIVIVREEEQVRRTVLAYVTVWIVAFAFFLAVPTVAPRPMTVTAQGFFAWGLRTIYSCDVAYNCFPSLHVAQSFVAALTCFRVHRGTGIAAIVWAWMIALSTLFTKQHYVADVVSGALLGYGAYLLFLRSYGRERVPELDRRLAPVLALGVAALHVISMAGFWVAYALG